MIIDKENAAPLSDTFEEYEDGFNILINKPYRWTSADVVRKIKFKLQHHFKKKNIKVGHAGTLDPLATGVLILSVGKATKRSEELQAQVKEYIAEITFGATTPSFDLEKEIDATYPYEHITLPLIEKALIDFIGEQEQLPPIYSAKLINGMRAYQKARLGEEVELKHSIINIYSIDIIDYVCPKLTIRIKCSKGTYIRALARDIGIALESGAHLTALTRTASGQFCIERSITVDECEILFKN